LGFLDRRRFGGCGIGIGRLIGFGGSGGLLDAGRLSGFGRLRLHDGGNQVRTEEIRAQRDKTGDRAAEITGMSAGGDHHAHSQAGEDGDDEGEPHAVELQGHVHGDQNGDADGCADDRPDECSSELHGEVPPPVMPRDITPQRFTPTQDQPPLW
jgi:hypothetical protein